MEVDKEKEEEKLKGGAEEKKGGHPLGPERVFMVATLFAGQRPTLYFQSEGLTPEVQKKTLVVLIEFTESTPQ